MTGKIQALVLFIVWAVVSAAGIAVASAIDYFPSPGSLEAHTIDNAMTVMMVLSVPVFTMVVVLLVYSMVRFRHNGEPEEDGPPIQGNLPLEVTWVVVTFALTVFLAGYGIRELLALRSHGHGAEAAQNELVVEARGSRWFWQFTYPEQGIASSPELVLPVGRRVRFQVTASDVIHSFWVPSFRSKIDAVPGITTTVYATPDRVGSFKEDYNFRVQCAELCGLGHATMKSSVTVVEQKDFDAWVSQKKGASN
ncbi:MAG: cytochrome c oxidase, subunit [Dehalococcoidia bacterium]|nr:cytochrome c oxidase, subunit [Dehalococcoidia bacterium]